METKVEITINFVYRGDVLLAKMLKCPTCGSHNEYEAKRCNQCGAWLLDEYWKPTVVEGFSPFKKTSAKKDSDSVQPISHNQKSVFARIGWFYWGIIAFTLVLLASRAFKSVFDVTVFLLLYSVVALVVGIVTPTSVIKWGQNRTRPMVIKTVIPLVFCLLIFGLYVAPKSNRSIQPTNSQNIVAMEQYKASCKLVDYDTLARTTEVYVGQRIVLDGKVTQVKEGSSGYINIDITKVSTGIWKDTVWVNYKRPADTNRILDGDVVRVWGSVKGRKTYTSALSQSITLPEIDAKYVDLIEKRQ